MILKSTIENGLARGIIKIVDGPDGGAVCQIGEYWFYFGGCFAIGSTAENYIKTFSFDSIAWKLYEALNDMREAGGFEDELSYYEAYLHEKLEVKR